jgi:hypothetical protein
MNSKDKIDIKVIILEEAIRAIALVGIVMFVVLPISYLLGADLTSIAMIAFPTALLSFPCITLIRIRTGFDLQLCTSRGWYIVGAITFALVLSVSILTVITGYASWNQAVVRIVASVLFIAVFDLVGARLMKLRQR